MEHQGGGRGWGKRVGEGRGVRAKPWPGLLLLRYADGNIKDCHLPGFIHIRIHIYISYLTSDIHHAIHHENGIDATRFRKCELMCLGGRVSSSLFSLSCVYVKLILTYWRVIRNSITFTMLLYFFFFFVRTPESTDCQNFSISLKIFNLTTSTFFRS